MKIIFTVILFLLSTFSFSQNENKRYTFEELWSIYIPKDTTVRLINYSNGNLKRKRIIYSAINNENNDVQLFLHKEEIYRQNGILKKETFYKRGLYDKIFLYHKNGKINAEGTCEYDNGKHFVTVNGKIRGDVDIFHETIYAPDGKKRISQSFKKQKRYGTHKIYDFETGELKKIKKFKDGKKVSTEKF